MSSVYPVWWDSTITVYNKYEDPQTNLVTWYRTVLNGCFWKYTGQHINVGGTVIQTNDSICRIPKQTTYLNRGDWLNIPNDQRDSYFTFSPGDIIIKGEVTDVVNEYVTGSRSSDLLKKYKGLQGCLEIKDVGVNIGIGRGMEHYLVRGD